VWPRPGWRARTGSSCLCSNNQRACWQIWLATKSYTSSSQPRLTACHQLIHAVAPDPPRSAPTLCGRSCRSCSWRWRALWRRRRRQGGAVLRGRCMGLPPQSCFRTGLVATLQFHHPTRIYTQPHLAPQPNPTQPPPYPQASRSAAAGRMSQVWAVRASVDPFLDVARSTFNRLTGLARAQRRGRLVDERRRVRRPAGFS
jgi:hypothetical protein